ncbi:MAG: nicotinate (nicotinamide) nucleotide adenylyltransferase [Eubacteriales bacterium]
MRIGLFGGTFNPPHLGHTALARSFYAQSRADLLIVMPSFLPPHKASAAVSPTDRLAMTRLAFLPLGKEGVNYTVSDYEIAKGDTSYTIYTVKHLLEVYGEKTLALCVGSDMFLSFESWKCAQELLSLCELYTLARHPGEEPRLNDYAASLCERFHARVCVMSGNVLEVSSTGLREKADASEALLDPAVRDYARKHRLYC